MKQKDRIRRRHNAARRAALKALDLELKARKAREATAAASPGAASGTSTPPPAASS
jgi:hypothetical protein